MLEMVNLLSRRALSWFAPVGLTIYDGDDADCYCNRKRSFISRWRRGL